MKTYLEIKVPIRYDAKWFEQLRTAFRDTPAVWQQGFFHITMAFCDETPIDVDLNATLEKHLGKAVSPELTFDYLNAFVATSGMYIVHLGVSKIPESFSSLVEAIRKDLIEAGCKLQSDFKLHVTLGRIKDMNIELSTIQQLAKSVSLHSFTLKLTEVDYREFRGKVIYETKLS